MTAALMVTAVACNTKIKVNFEAKASDYVKLGQYKGITVSVDEQAIENELIEKKVQNDLTSNTTYDEVSREARDKDQVTVDFTGTIGGEEVSGFSNEDYSLILGTDTFVIDGRLMYDNCPLEKILNDLGRWYAFDVFYSREEARSYQFSVNMKKHEVFTRVLELIEKTGDIKFEIKGKTVIVK